MTEWELAGTKRSHRDLTLNLHRKKQESTTQQR